MDKIKEALWNDYEEKKELLNDMEPGSDEYKVVASEVDNIRKELIDVDKTVAENEFKVTQAADDSKKEKTRNRISIGTFITSTALSLYAIGKTFKFDSTSTVTSTLGRNILNAFIPKKR
ncbi:MAG: hypothetical protein SOT58_12720 [Agathobacter sp.]|nr:hypothetical protein [Agathobacter sp.]